MTHVRDQEFQEHSPEASPGPAFQTNELCNLQSAFEADLRLHRDPANLAYCTKKCGSSAPQLSPVDYEA